MDLMMIILVVALLMIASGAVYHKLEVMSITEPYLALVLGVIVGPDVLDSIKSASPHKAFEVLKTDCELTIGIALLATPLRLPKHILRKNFVTLSNLVIFGMIFMCLLSAGVFYFILPDLSFFACVLLGAIITPTDPVVASTLTTGKTAKKYLPKFIKDSLSF